MKKLSEVVNVVPVIAKSDSLTPEERDAFKTRVRLVTLYPEKLLILFRQIRAELVHHNIRLYPFDTDENDEEELAQNDTIRVCHIQFP